MSEAASKDVLPIVRRIPFGFPEDISPHWHPARPEWSHMITGGSLAMPYLEPFLIDTMRDALEHIDDPGARAKGLPSSRRRASTSGTTVSIMSL